MPVPACGNGRARAEEPQARRSPLEGAVNPRARRSPLEGGVHPRARRSLLEGTFEWAALVGRGGHRSVGRAPCVRLSEMRFAGFKRDFPSCFRGPSGLSPTKTYANAEGKLMSRSTEFQRQHPARQGGAFDSFGHPTMASSLPTVPGMQCSCTSQRQPKWSARLGGRAGRTREVPKGAMASVLRQRGTLRLQDALLTNAETCVCDLDDQVQAPTLLRRASHHRGVQVSTREDHLKPRGRRKDHQVSA
jgi:hypothetical protein